MPQENIHTTISRPRIVAFLRALPALLSGKTPDPHGIAAGFRARLAFGLFSEIARSFDIKSKGGTDDAGDSWTPNTKKYLAYGKGPKSKREGTGHSPQWPKKKGSGYLSAADMENWWAIYRQALAGLAPRHPIGTAKTIAAKIAWKAWTDAGGETLLNVYGNRDDTVLVDRGTLRRTILPGEITELGPSARYSKNHPEQIFRQATGEVVVGTKATAPPRKRADGTSTGVRASIAAIHHQGRGRNPERRLWPRTLPLAWLERINTLLIGGVGRMADLLRGRGQI